MNREEAGLRTELGGKGSELVMKAREEDETMGEKGHILIGLRQLRDGRTGREKGKREGMLQE